MGDFGNTPKDKWVCPNDRQLALRAKLKTGWSVKTGQLNSYSKPEQLNDDEQEIIIGVIKRAETLEHIEQERIGRLVEKLENMKKNMMGNGTNQCILCGDDFGILGASNLTCNDCRKVVCTKCGVDTISSQKEPLWLCKVCSETREMWKKSGAWFFKGVPKYIIPEKRQESGKYNLIGGRFVEGRMKKQGSSPKPRSFNTWSKGVKNSHELSDQETETSSDDDLHVKGMRHRKKGDSVDSGDSLLSMSPHASSVISPGHQSLRSGEYRISNSSYHESVSTADATYGDESRDEHSDSERSFTSEVFRRDSPLRSTFADRTSSASMSVSSTGRGDEDKEPERAFVGYGSDRFNGTAPYRSNYYHHHQSASYGHHGDREVSAAFHQMSLNESPVDDFYEERYSPEEASFGTLEYSLLYDSVNNALHCTLRRAKGLRPMDSSGLSDPYVKLHLLPGASKSNKLRTKTVHKTLNPEFNETLTYYGITENDMLRKTLRMSVLDEDSFGHDFIGEVRIPLSRLKSHQTLNENAPLEKQSPLEKDDDLLSGENDRGRILLSLAYSTQKQAFIVGIIRCANLPALDSNGLSDPFVKVQLRPDPKRWKTLVKWKNLNPEFNEEFSFDVTKSELLNKTLEITVWDKDYGRTNDYIGGLHIGIKSKGERLRHFLDTIRAPDRRHECWHRLSDEVLSEIF